MSNKDKVSKEHRRNGKDKNVSKYHLKKTEDLEYTLDTLRWIAIDNVAKIWRNLSTIIIIVWFEICVARFMLKL